MPPNSKSSLGESSKKSKLNLKITQDDQRLTIDLLDRTVNQDQRIAEPLTDSIVIEPPFRNESLGCKTKRSKKTFSRNNCLNIFEKKRSSSPEPDTYKHLKEIIIQANDSWSHFFLPLIHLGNIDPNRERVTRLMENFKHARNLISTRLPSPSGIVQPSASQLSNSESHDLRLFSAFDEKNSSSSSGSHSEKSKFNKLDALKTEIDKTINEISTFKNEVLYNEPNKLVQTSEIGINTEISMSNAVFKIKYEDEEDEDDNTRKSSIIKETEKTNYKSLMDTMPLIESPSDTNSYNKANRSNLPALTLLKNLTKKYNLSSMNESDLSSPGTSRKNSKFHYNPKVSHLESDSLDDYRLRQNTDYLLDDNNIFKKIFSRNLEKDKRMSYINLEPIKKNIDSSSNLSSSSNEVYQTKRTSKILRKKDFGLYEERKRHSLKKLPVHDFGTTTSKRHSSEYKLKMIPLQKSVEQTKFHCCCCKCSCMNVPVYKTITTTTTTKIPASSLKAESTSDASAKSSDSSAKTSQNLNSYYFKSTKNHRKKNEFGLLSQESNRNMDKKSFDFRYFMLDSLEEREKSDKEDEFNFIKNLINENESNGDADFHNMQTNIQCLLDSLHRPHSAFQYSHDKANYVTNSNEFNSKTRKNHQNQIVFFFKLNIK